MELAKLISYPADMRSEIILELLLDVGRGTAELVRILTVAGYAEAYRARWRTVPRRISPREQTDRVDERETQRLYAILYKLKRQGLVKKRRRGRSSMWFPTSAGRTWFAGLRARRLFSTDRISYQPSERRGIQIISFDVPERERHKRVWLRAVLKAIGFRYLQKSVWIGDWLIPEDFLEDLRERRMLAYVHIFSVTKSGTLRELA